MRRTAWRKIAAVAVAGAALGLLPLATPASAATTSHPPAGTVTLGCVEWGCHPSSN
jgi:hypothetical protein